jgi:hypothetical protein
MEDMRASPSSKPAPELTVTDLDPPTHFQNGGPKVEMPGDLASFFDDGQEVTRQNDPVNTGWDADDPAFGLNDLIAPNLDDDEDQVKSSDFNPDATVVTRVPDALLKASSFGNDEIAIPSPSPGPAVPPPKAPPISNPPDTSQAHPLEPANSLEDEHFKEVYEALIQAKTECGESLAGLTLEKFTEKLRKNTADLKSKYKCRSVKFQVYVKSGKAALKATPIK